jgi:hypothetical protein
MSGLIVVGDDASRTRAINAMLAFLEALQDTFPECQLCQDAVVNFNKLVVPDEYLQDQACYKWLHALAAPLPASVAKYAPPLERLIGNTPQIYHALAFKDGDTLVQCGHIPLIEHLALGEKWHRPDFAEDRHVMLAYIEHITKVTLEYCHVEGLGPAPEVPTREEIEAEISRYAAEQREALPAEEVNVGSAFAATLGSIAEMLEMHSETSSAEAPPTTAQLQSEWDLLMKNERFQAMCDARDIGAIACLETSSIPAFANARESYLRMDEAAQEELWGAINNLVSFSTVAGIMPPNLRGKIENVAAGLAADIQNGTLSLDDLNPDKLMAIGNSVLAGTTEADVQALAGSMDKLLPAVATMSRQNAYMKSLSDKAGLSGLL